MTNLIEYKKIKFRFDLLFYQSITNKQFLEMKQFFTLLTFLCLTNLSFGQILYQQDFTNGFLDMILINKDGRTPAPNVSTYVLAWNISDFFSNNNKAAVSNSWYVPAGRADDWMITPVISGITEKSVIFWDAVAIDADFPDGYEVLVSSNGGSEIADFKDVIFKINGERPVLTNRAVSLGAFAGKDIRIAFRNNSNDMFLLLVDNIVVTNLPTLDGAAEFVATNRYNKVGEPVVVEYAIKNTGFTKMTDFVLEWSNGEENFTEEVSGLDLNFNDVHEGTLTFTPTESNQFDITLALASINGSVDDDSTNNILYTVTNAVSKVISKKLIAEEGTGTWCVWCPRGAVFMERMAKEFPNEFIGIAVHNNDPMVLAAYDMGIRNFPNFGGYPSVIVNREEVIDPSQLPAYLNIVTRNEYSPIEVNVEQTKTNRIMTVAGDITFYTSIPEANLSLVAVIVEDGVKGTTSAYNQANAYAGGNNGIMGGYELLPNPVPAAQMVYNEVGRGLPFGFNGSSSLIPSVIKDGDVVPYSFQYTVPSAFNMDNIHSVVFLIDNTTGAVLSGNKTKNFLTVNVNEVSELTSLSIFPNPTDDIAYINMDLNETSEISVTIINNIGQEVASKSYGKLSGQQLLPINTDMFGTGIYFVKIQVNNSITTQKLIVR